MGADYYFRMGSTHSICQDYALAGESNGVAYAILSDGCSGISKPEQPGSPYTDIGARFLVLSSLRNLADIAEGRHPLTKIMVDADAMRRQASLPSDSLDATLLMAAEKNGIISLAMTGDGVFVTRNRSGVLEYTRREFENGMPAYLNYQIKTSAQEDYLSKATTYTEYYGTKTESGYQEADNLLENSSVHSSYCRLTFFRKETDLILLFSDGIQSFVDSNTNHPIPVGDVLDVILDLPRMSGQFLTRSCNYFLKKHCVEKGWVHHDDFSCAGIYMP
jgi:hypothetical protein